MHAKRSHVIIVISVLALFLVTVYATDYRSGWMMIKNASALTSCI
jgi:preprotein translocase subunit SecE